MHASPWRAIVRHLPKDPTLIEQAPSNAISVAPLAGKEDGRDAAEIAFASRFAWARNRPVARTAFDYLIVNYPERSFRQRRRSWVEAGRIAEKN